MNILRLGIICLLVICLFVNYFYTKRNIGITVDGKKYFINNTTPKRLRMEKVRVLKKLQGDANFMIEKLIENKDSYSEFSVHIEKLRKNWSGFIEELNEIEKKTIFAYNVNKGEQISICLTNRKSGELNKYNEIMYVLLHELAHVMAENYAHDDEFWRCFRFLIEFATKIGIYKKMNYKKNPQEFCNAYLNE